MIILPLAGDSESERCQNNPLTSRISDKKKKEKRKRINVVGGGGERVEKETGLR